MKFRKGDKVWFKGSIRNFDTPLCEIVSGIPNTLDGYNGKTYYRIKLPNGETVGLLQDLLELHKKVSKSKFVFEDFFEAFHFLNLHKNFNDKYGYPDFNPDIEVVKVNPETKRIDDNKKLNTETNVWLEANTHYQEYGGVWTVAHDTDLDCGGVTYEEVIIKMANLLYKRDLKENRRKK